MTKWWGKDRKLQQDREQQNRQEQGGTFKTKKGQVLGEVKTKTQQFNAASKEGKVEKGTPGKSGYTYSLEGGGSVERIK